MLDMEDYVMGGKASAAALLLEFTNVRSTVKTCENILFPVDEKDPDVRKFEAIRDALNLLLTLDSQLSIYERIAENVWSKVYRAEEELWHLQAASEQSNG